jgi:hypothetical protein
MIYGTPLHVDEGTARVRHWQCLWTLFHASSSTNLILLWSQHPPPNTQVVSEYVRTFMKRVEEQRAPMQLQLPIVLRGNEAVQE